MLVAILGVTALAVGLAGGRQTPRQVATRDREPVRLQFAEDIPAATRESLRAVARQAGVNPAELLETGAAKGANGAAAVIVGTSGSGSPVFARVVGGGHSGFLPLHDALVGGKDLFISGGIAGTRTSVREVSVVGVVSPSVATVKIERADGSEVGITLTRWPRGGYASFAVVADDATAFPTVVRAYAANGRLLGTEHVDIRPLCPPTKPDCID
jgi:hypothetical protein